MRAVRWLVLGSALLVIGVIATLPLRLVLPVDTLPFAALEAQGSIWNGTLRGVTWTSMDLGDVGVRLRPLPLLRGQRQVQLRSATAQLVALQGARQGVQQANGRLLLPKPGGVGMLDLSIDLREVQAVFDATRCTQAGGDVAVQVLPNAGGEAAGLLPLRLRGSPRCVDDAVVLVLALAPDSGLREGVGLGAELRVQHDGRWQWRTQVEPGNDTALQLGLQLLGFVQTPERWLVRVDQGQW
ncbi:type II secretion system protein N [Xanthomonas vesicatoria]|uniref:Type II secretion system protein N n=1 Tax=Xanthomonas vesicatoria ATCC 35937 TaxID=925775 RepID=F0BB22_9XANT|nr:type II secretion system protein N [Xanthomonas vesicatoria]APP76537.1 type II secretion system protein N [Xanthomonas vesicatoria ATCC 35937]EGD10441.1 Type II secretion system protein N [Xanthomonas vesicatoria ATCC 35937]KTF33862.1 type II secretion system protein N [Xanthomonas vesicatoria]MCC8597146.1 type II secretion system protein N [Xanthomonas vesicatoria]MCC8605523.1 type II secretion system protein N [Xanthomonas vesicatoria]